MIRQKHLLCVVTLAFATTAAYPDSPVRPSETTGPLETLRTLYPEVRTNMEASQLRSVYGRAMTTGATAQESADRFRLAHAEVFAAESDDLIPGAWFTEDRLTQPLMFDRETGQFKFTLVYYSQRRSGIPVFRGELRVLVRNEPGNPVVWVKSTIRNLGGFEPQVLRAGAATGMALEAAMAVVPSLVNFTEPQTVIWSGVSDIVAEPVTALTFIGDNGNLDGFNPEKELFVVDAATGEILYQEDQILELDITGNVSGMTTDGNGADVCHSQVLTPHAYARVYVSFPGDFADVNGDFVLANAGTEDVTLTSTVQGEWFTVLNSAGSPSRLTPTVTPPGPVELIHNEINDPFHLAEVNAYVHANIVRDFVLFYEPFYPVIFNQNSFQISVNVERTDIDTLCPCNAQYTGSRMRFCRAGSGCNNTAFSTVVHHEYGHHLVNKAGSGQGQYGEGMGDVMGVMITEESQLGIGFTGNCNSGIRTADNNMQYPCSGAIHTCGQLISGCVWDMRSELMVEDPVGYIDTLAGLTIAAMLLHTGDLITPQITLDILTLDDDDADLSNGTPHYHAICTGYGVHNMAPDCDPDCNANNLPDPWEIDQDLAADTNGNGIPDECDPDCNGNLIPDDLDIADCVGDPACADCNNNQKPDSCDITECTTPIFCGDCDGNGVLNQCEGVTAVGDCDGDGVCNANQIASCGGTVDCADCNGNGWPDSCDLGPLGSGDDCNNNAVPDTCDVADLTSPDGNGNVVPDECEFAKPAKATYPHDRKKNRYISFSPDNAANADIILAFKVELLSINMGSCDDGTGAQGGNVDFCRADRGSADCKACSGSGDSCISAAIDCSPGESCDPTGAVCVNDLANSGGSNVGIMWWVGPEKDTASNPDLNIHLLVSEPFRKESGDWPDTIHSGDCEVVPQASYGVRAVEVAGSTASDELVVETTQFPPGSPPAPFWWGDVVGGLVFHCNADIREQTCDPDTSDGDCSGPGSPAACCTGVGTGLCDCPGGDPCERAWELPNGVTNVDDVTAALWTSAPAPPTTVSADFTWVDVHGNDSFTSGSQNFDPPNNKINASDLQQIGSAFGGLPYKFYDPADCLDESDWPPP